VKAAHNNQQENEEEVEAKWDEEEVEELKRKVVVHLLGFAQVY